MKQWARKKSGFTIVELLIVVVVIAILAAITIVSYNGIQEKAMQTARIDEVQKWQKIILSYAATNGTYPSALTLGTKACLGEGFPDNNNDGIGNCWDLHVANHTSTNATLNTQLRTVGSLPNNTRKPVDGASGASRIGPVLELNAAGQYAIIYWQRGLGTCPVGTARWNDGSNSSSCGVVLPALN